MQLDRIGWVCVLALSFVACEDQAAVSTDGGVDGGVDGDAVGTLAVIPCQKFGPTGGLAEASSPSPMQRHDLDTSAFPDALCNDGTAAVFYFRPYVGDANRDRWLIELQGGGACRAGDTCAARWCNEGTNFSATQMSSSRAPKQGIDGNGIDARIAPNAFGDFNQVFVRYCSSDSWLGTRRDVVLTGADPRPGVDASYTYRIHFEGANILDAALATLRQDGVAALAYTAGGGTVALPDLDEATMVIFAGASAGGTGVAENADRVGALLRDHNVACGTSAACPLEYRVLIDSSLALDAAKLDFSTATFCAAPPNLCTYEALFRSEADVGAQTIGRRGDASCVAWHQANAPGSEWQCVDTDHVIRHHVTSPMFIRTGQRDMLHLGNMMDATISIAGQGLITPQSFAAGLRSEGALLASLPATAEEGSAITTIPGVFMPTCERHDTLESNPNIFDVTIPSGGVDYTMLRVFGNWRTGASPAALITPEGVVDVCP